MNATATGGVLAVLLVTLGWWVLPTLPPWVGLLLLLPSLLAGIGLVLQSSAGRGLGMLGTVLAEDSPIHTVLVLIGWALIGAALLGLMKLPPAGAADVVVLTRQLEQICRTPHADRADLRLLTQLQALERRLPDQAHALRAEAHAALQTNLPRCLERIDEAAADPRGTHTSWRKVYEWIAEHPEHVGKRTLPHRTFRPRTHRPKRPPLEVLIER